MMQWKRQSNKKQHVVKNPIPINAVSISENERKIFQENLQLKLRCGTFRGPLMIKAV